MASNELLQETGWWSGEFLYRLTSFPSRIFYLRDKRGNTTGGAGEWDLKYPHTGVFRLGLSGASCATQPTQGALLYASGLALRREGVKQQRGWMLLEQWTCNHCTIGRKQHQQDHSTSYLPAAGSAHDSGLSGPILTHPLCSLLRLADVFQTQIIRVPGEPAAPALPGKTLLRAPALESVERCWCSPGTQQLRSK